MSAIDDLIDAVFDEVAAQPDSEALKRLKEKAIEARPVLEKLERPVGSHPSGHDVADKELKGALEPHILAAVAKQKPTPEESKRLYKALSWEDIKTMVRPGNVPHSMRYSTYAQLSMTERQAHPELVEKELKRFRGLFMSSLNTLRRDCKREDGTFFLRNSDQRLLREIGPALERLDEGDFGFCLVCDAPIGLRQLEANPTRLRCPSCDEDHDLAILERIDE